MRAPEGADRGRAAGRRRDGEDVLPRLPDAPDCRYLAQVDTIKNFEGRRIVIAAHEAAFLPMPFASDLVVVDEDLATKAARVVEIDPARLLDPERWEDAPDLLGTAAEVAGRWPGGAGSWPPCARPGSTPRGSRRAPPTSAGGTRPMVEAIAEAGGGGAPEEALGRMVDALQAAEFRKLALLFANLRQEIATGRAGANATRLVRRRKTVSAADGTEAEERLDRYVVSRPRAHSLGKGKELVLLDGTGDLGLVRRVFGGDVREHRCAPPRAGSRSRSRTPPTPSGGSCATRPRPGAPGPGSAG